MPLHTHHLPRPSVIPIKRPYPWELRVKGRWAIEIVLATMAVNNNKKQTCVITENTLKKTEKCCKLFLNCKWQASVAQFSDFNRFFSTF